MTPIKILIACGSGIATSSFVGMEVENICKENGIDCRISKVRIVDVPTISKEYDVCFTASKYSKEVDCPTYPVSGLITGLNVEKTKEFIKEKLLETLKAKEN